jgi:hypothetical protein
MQKYAAEVEALYSGVEPGKASVAMPSVQTADTSSSMR